MPSAPSHAGRVVPGRKFIGVVGIAACIYGHRVRPRLWRWGPPDEEATDQDRLMTDARGQTPRTTSSGLRRAGFTTGGVAVAASLGLMTYPLWRDWCLTWGAADDEPTRTLPGDDLLENPDLLSTRAISIGAPTNAVWPWLAQMGSGRGGVYTYDWIENLFGLHMHSVDVVLPQFQNIQVGDAQQLGKNGPVLRVAVADPESALVLRSDDGNWVWAFCLVHEGTGTRLISRNRIATPGASWPTRAFYRYVMEPGSLVMERKMLLGIKQRAERLAPESEAQPIR